MIIQITEQAIGSDKISGLDIFFDYIVMSLGAEAFRGEAGVLYKANALLRAWAAAAQ